MNKDEIKALAESGAAFRLFTNDRKEYYVPHRDFISVMPDAQAVIVYQVNGNGYFTIIPVWTITSIQDASPEQKQP